MNQYEIEENQENYENASTLFLQPTVQMYRN